MPELYDWYSAIFLRMGHPKRGFYIELRLLMMGTFICQNLRGCSKSINLCRWLWDKGDTT